MMQLLKQLFAKWACMHDWEKIETANYWANGLDKPHSVTIIYCCKKCGKFKTVKL